jgi:hypothetical protein
MSTITCSSCQMEYDGTGLQAGVQFQCTQCGNMVVVGAAAKAPIGRNAARPRAAGGPPKRGGARGAGRAAPMAAGGQQNDGQQQGYAAPAKKSNVGLFIGLGIGAAVLIVIVIVVVMSSGPAPEDLTKEADKRRLDDRKKEIADEDARRLAEKQALTKTYDAAYAQGPAIEAALRGGNASTIENLFDWQAYALYNDTLISADPAAYLKSKDAPLLCVGEWDKDASGAPTGVFTGKTPLGPDGLKARVMFYIQEFYFGKEDIRYVDDRSKAHEGYKVSIRGTDYYTKPIYVSFKGGGVEKEFWVGAPKGSTDVRIINFRDKQAFPNLQGKEAKKERDDGRGDPFNRERDLTRDPEDPEDPRERPTDPDGDLPATAKTNAKPTVAALINAIEDLKRGVKLNTAKIQNIEKEPSKVEKKATMGALIDLLIDAVNGNDRAGKNRISSALYDVWQPFVPQGWEQDDMVYNIDFDGQSDADTVVRRWLDIYNSYKTE